MGFNVLKDPQDPRNFIITPAPAGGADPSLIEAGQQAGAASLLGRRAQPDIKGQAQTFGEDEPPASKRRFTAGLINLQGRMERAQFDKNRRAFELALVRGGVAQTTALQKDLAIAYQSSGGFELAGKMAEAHRLQQPEVRKQRELDIAATERVAQLNVENQENANEIQENQITDFARLLGQDSGQVVKARGKVNTFYDLQDDLVDVGTLFEKHGPIRINDLLDSDKVAVKQAYNDFRVTNIAAYRQAFELGVLQKSDMEFLNEEVWIPTDTFANLHPSARRVWLQNAQTRAKRIIENTIDNNIALREGSRSMQWKAGEGRPYLQIIAAEQPADTTGQSSAQVANFLQTQETRGETAAGSTPLPVELGGPDLTEIPAAPQDFSPSSEVSPPAPEVGILPSATTGERTGGPTTPQEIAVMEGAEGFFEGINELVGDFAKAEGVFAKPEDEEE